MIACCSKCTALFETTEEDACTPDTLCPPCFRRERQADAERRRMGLPTMAGTRAMFAALDRAREIRERSR
jgi:hypothetical protein